MKLSLALLALAPATASAQAPERRLRDADLRQMIDEGALLCEEPRDGRCAAIVRWDDTEGAARETRLETLGGEPIVDMALQFPVRVQDDQLCLTVRAEDIGYLFIVGGEERAAEQAIPLREPVARVWAGAEGREWCTAYYRDVVSGVLRAEVRIDGQPRLELDSSFHPITTSPLPALRAVRQPWTVPVLRAAGALAPAAEAPAEPPTPLGSATVALSPAPPAIAAASPPPPLVTDTVCQPDASRLSRLRRWMRLDRSPACRPN